MSTVLTPEFLKALELIDGGSRHLFVTGKAGTGKSTLLNHFRDTTKKNVAVLAPTGVAALNVRGQTIHSFFKFRADITPENVGRFRLSGDSAKLYRNLDTIVIDEVSMLRADLLDCIDQFLRRNGPDKNQPFGGVQMVFFGDLYQLPPVVTSADRARFNGPYKGPHFFHAEAMKSIGIHLIELSTIFRQQDEAFIELLNAVRSGTVTEEQLQALNVQHGAALEKEAAITITTTNAIADDINMRHLQALDTPLFTSKGITTGTFGERDAPSPATLSIKPGAQVMMVTNDPRGRWVNGSIGIVKRIYDDPETDTPMVDILLSDGRKIQVNTYTWELFKYHFNEDLNELEPEVTGTFKQYPLRLAWAVTIHKSQGKTFDNVVIDLGSGTFSPGQLYVALSRCRTLEGITLTRPIHARHVISDKKVNEYLEGFTEGYRETGQGNLFSEWGA